MIVIMFILSTTIAFPHSGRTDSNGGHRDTKNASGLGPYHFHHGFGAHLHDDGICPYSPKDTIQISNQPSTMDVGQSLDLEWELTYYSGSPSVTWSSSDSSIVAVSDGTLKSKKPGTATITATLYNGVKNFNVTVKEVPVISVSIQPQLSRLEVNETATFKCEIEPFNATYKNVTWESSNNSTAEVTKYGKITGIAPGIVTISATSKNGKKDSVNLEIYRILPTKIDITQNPTELELGSSGKLKADIIPSNVTNKYMYWESSNSSVIKVSANGDFKAVGVGSAAVIVNCQNISASHSIKIFKIQADSISFATDQMGVDRVAKLNVGDSVEPIVAFSPENATIRDITYSTSNPEIVNIVDGKLTALKSGKATITAYTPEVSTTLDISVKSKSHLAFILPPTAAIIFLGSAVLKKNNKL